MDRLEKNRQEVAVQLPVIDFVYDSVESLRTLEDECGLEYTLMVLRSIHAARRRRTPGDRGGMLTDADLLRRISWCDGCMTYFDALFDQRLAERTGVLLIDDLMRLKAEWWRPSGAFDPEFVALKVQLSARALKRIIERHREAIRDPKHALHGMLAVDSHYAEFVRVFIKNGDLRRAWESIVDGFDAFCRTERKEDVRLIESSMRTLGALVDEMTTHIGVPQLRDLEIPLLDPYREGRKREFADALARTDRVAAVRAELISAYLAHEAEVQKRRKSAARKRAPKSSVHATTSFKGSTRVA